MRSLYTLDCTTCDDCRTLRGCNRVCFLASGARLFKLLFMAVQFTKSVNSITRNVRSDFNAAVHNIYAVQQKPLLTDDVISEHIVYMDMLHHSKTVKCIHAHTFSSSFEMCKARNGNTIWSTRFCNRATSIASAESEIAFSPMVK